MAWKRHWVGWARWRANNKAATFLNANPDLIARAVGVPEGDYETLTEVISEPFDRAALHKELAQWGPPPGKGESVELPKMSGWSKRELGLKRKVRAYRLPDPGWRL